MSFYVTSKNRLTGGYVCIAEIVVELSRTNQKYVQNAVAMPKMKLNTVRNMAQRRQKSRRSVTD